MKEFFVIGFAALSMMTVSTTVDALPITQIVARANEVRVASGQGNGYRYEIWTDSRNQNYWLKVWQVADYPNGPLVNPRYNNFRSMGEAHDAFGCQFERKSLPSCAAWMPRRTY